MKRESEKYKEINFVRRDVTQQVQHHWMFLPFGWFSSHNLPIPCPGSLLLLLFHQGRLRWGSRKGPGAVTGCPLMWHGGLWGGDSGSGGRPTDTHPAAQSKCRAAAPKGNPAPGPWHVGHLPSGLAFCRNWLRLTGHRHTAELLLHHCPGLGLVLSLQFIHHRPPLGQL